MSVNGESDLAQFRVQRHFADHRAISPDTAIEYAPSGPVERKAFERLRAVGLIQEAHPAHYWFDPDRMGAPRRQRNPKTRVAILLATLLAIAGYFMFRS
ncbi:MAG: hypothetical protein CVT77_17855 [Alphaproteobacteria bacterium HGW-Alphaproteobacteria-16]|nr:MAG: hypothetical protein CVT77_17855 [Alphaproteobacteria bacterium HGW-Alphaproteobacteria-16]